MAESMVAYYECFTDCPKCGGLNAAYLIPPWRRLRCSVCGKLSKGTQEERGTLTPDYEERYGIVNVNG